MQSYGLQFQFRVKLRDRFGLTCDRFEIAGLDHLDRLLAGVASVFDAEEVLTEFMKVDTFST